MPGEKDKGKRRRKKPDARRDFEGDPEPLSFQVPPDEDLIAIPENVVTWWCEGPRDMTHARKPVTLLLSKTGLTLRGRCPVAVCGKEFVSLVSTKP